jgi:iron uptake system EfeUOB component EfeO/EfeM
MPNSVFPSPRLLRVAVAGSVILMIAAGGLFYYAAQVAAHKRKAHAGQETVVTILDHQCEPANLSVPAGQATFRIVNASDRAVEWEILDGVLVLEERENIAPGMSQIISASLEPGHYAVTCGLLSNPRGTLTVTATAQSQARAAAHPPLTAFIGPLSEYRVYLSQQGSALIKAVDELARAIDAGDLAQARQRYAPARAAYQRIAPAAQRLAELDNAIDARADYFEKREQDPAFTGFHRLEYGLFGHGAANGQPLAAVAHTLLTDVTALKGQLMAQPIPPGQLIAMVSRNLRSLADHRFTGEEERYSHLDLNGFAANLEGAAKVISLMRPLVEKTAGEAQAAIDQASTALDQQLQAQRGPEGYRPYDQLAASQRQAIADRARDLANALDAIDPALGLSDL